MENPKYFISRHSPENGCYAENGEQLLVAKIKAWPKKAKPHYFIGANSGKQSRFAWVASDPVGGKELTESHDIEDETRLKILDMLSRLKQGDPVALDFVPRGIPPKLELLLHRVLLMPVNSS